MQGTQSAAVEPPKKEEKAEKPRPMIFAIMRNGHEVIRGSMRDVQAALDKGDFDEAKVTWDKLEKWSVMHMLMEEGTDGEGSPIGLFK